MSRERDRLTNCRGQDLRLAALLDGELVPEQRQEIEAHVRVCPRCSAELQQARLARSALRRSAEGLSAPPQLRARVEAALLQPVPKRSSRQRALFLGGLAAALAIIAFVAFTASGFGRPGPALLRQAVKAHQQRTLSSEPVSFASSDNAAVAAWLRTETGLVTDVPSFAADGYRLLGARTESEIGPQAATIVYIRGDSRLTCLVLPPPGIRAPALPFEPKVRAESLTGLGVADWEDEDTTYVLVANAEPAVVRQLAAAATEQSR